MSVLVVSGEYPPQPGGVGDYTAQLAGGLRRQGVSATVLTSAVAGRADEPGVWRRVPNWSFGSWRRVRAALDASRADLLHIQYQAGAYQLKGAVHLLPLWLQRQRPGVRVVTTFHDLLVPYLFPKAGPLRALAVRTLLRTSHGAIFVDAADLARAGPGPNRRWVPAGSNVGCCPPPNFDRAAVRRALGAHRDELLIGYFGFLSAGKGAETLLRAVRRLLDEGRAVRLALIGATAGVSNPSDRADEAAALTLARRLGLEGLIRQTGYLAPAAVSAHLLACDLLALPYVDGASFRRGSLLAALEHGRPIVTTTPAPTARGLGGRTLEPGRQVLAVPSGDPAALAAALARLADDPALAARLAAAARALAAHFSWDAIAAETAEVYAAARRPLDDRS